MYDRHMEAAIRFLSKVPPFFFLFLLSVTLGIPRGAFAATWGATVDPSINTLSGLAISADGQTRVTGESGVNGDLYITRNGGASWSVALSGTSAGNVPWSSVAVSADGHRIVGVQQGGHIWMSSNSGLTWSQVGPGTTDDWFSVSMTADGQYMAAVSASDGVVEISSDYGATWSSAPNISANVWDTVSYSPDGSYLIVGDADASGHIALSTDQGASWDETIGPATEWYAVSVANDGTMIGGGSSLYRSTDGGTTWANLGLTDTGSWDMTTITSDGASMLAATDNGHVWLSDDHGATWNQQGTLPGVAQWLGLALTTDGEIGVALNYDGHLFAFAATTPDAPTLDTATAGTNSVTLSFTAPTDDGAQPITDYLIEYSPAGANSWATFTDGVSASDSATVTGLSEGSSYDFRVSAVNDIGTSSPSSTKTATIPSSSISARGVHGGSVLSHKEPQTIVIPTTSITHATSTSSSSTLPMLPVRDLTVGMRGSDVRALQELLISMHSGVAASALVAHGTTDYFGPLTKAALAEYQKSLGIKPALGYFGPVTRAVMTKLFSKFAGN